MRITFRHDTTIEAPIQKVWNVVSDFGRYHRWCSLITEILPVKGTDEKIKPGAKFVRKFNYGFPFGASEEIITVIQVVPRHYFAFKHGNIFIKVLHLVYLREMPRGTYVVLITVYRGYFIFLVLPLWYRLKNLQRKFLQELREQCEKK